MRSVEIQIVIIAMAAMCTLLVGSLTGGTEIFAGAVGGVSTAAIAALLTMSARVGS